MKRVTSICENRHTAAARLHRQTVRTESGRVVRYREAVVLATGAWTNQVLGLAALPLLPLAVAGRARFASAAVEPLSTS